MIFKKIYIYIYHCIERTEHVLEELDISAIKVYICLLLLLLLLCNIVSPLRPLCHMMSLVIDIGREVLEQVFSVCSFLIDTLFIIHVKRLISI